MIHQKDVWKIVASILGDDSVRFIPTEEQTGPGNEQQNWKNQQEHLESLCNELNDVMQFLDIKPSGDATANLPEKIEHVESYETEINQIKEAVTHLSDRSDEIASKRSELEKQQETLAAITTLDVPLDLWKDAGLTAVIFGWIPADQGNLVALSFQSVPLILIPLQRQENRLFIAAASLKKHAFILRRLLSSLYFEHLEISPDEASWETSSSDLQEKIHQLDQQKDLILKEREQLAEKYRDRIQHLYHTLHANEQICRAIRQYGLPGEYYHFEIRGQSEQMQKVAGVVADLAKHPYNILSIETESKVA